MGVLARPLDCDSADASSYDRLGLGPITLLEEAENSWLALGRRCPNGVTDRGRGALPDRNEGCAIGPLPLFLERRSVLVDSRLTERPGGWGRDADVERERLGVGARTRPSYTLRAVTTPDDGGPAGLAAVDDDDEEPLLERADARTVGRFRLSKVFGRLKEPDWRSMLLLFDPVEREGRG